MQLDKAKLKTVILYACTRADPHQLGAVKLHKLLYYSDMLHFVQSGAPITGSTYRKRPFGPTCDQLLSVLREMEASGAIRTRQVDYFGYLKTEYIPLEKPNLDAISKSAMMLLDEVIEFVCNKNTAKTISEYSHNRAWEMADPGEVLTYASAFRMFPTQVSEETLNWASEQESSVERLKAEKADLGLKPFGTLRARVLARMGEK